MVLPAKNAAFIDAANLHHGLLELGWKLDYRKFRIWLREKHGVGIAYIFIGKIERKDDLYANFTEAGFTLIFKETLKDRHGKIKGNCDTDLVLWAVRGALQDQFEKAVIVSSDGDYVSLVNFLKDRRQFKMLISPNNKCSILLQRTQVPLTYLEWIRQKVESP